MQKSNNSYFSSGSRATNDPKKIGECLPRKRERTEQAAAATLPSSSSDKPVIELPIPTAFLRAVFHSFLGQYLYVEDDFVQTVRKFAVSVLFVVSFVAIGGAVWYGNMSATLGHNLADLLECIAMAITAASSVSTYVQLRLQKTCTDAMALQISVTSSCMWTATQLCTTSFPNAWISAMIIFAMVTRSPGLWFFCPLHLLYAVHSVVTSAYQHTPGAWLLLVPGTRVTQGLEPLILGLIMLAPGAMVITTVWFSFQEQGRQVRVANGTSSLTKQVVDLLRKYDTEGVSEILDDVKTTRSAAASDSGRGSVNREIDPAMMESFEALVKNLEKYRPFLPNYLFLAPDSDEENEGGDDDDSEGTLSAADGDSSTVGISMLSESGVSANNSQRASLYAKNQAFEITRRRKSSRPTALSAVSAHQYQGLVTCATVELKSDEWFSSHHHRRNSGVVGRTAAATHNLLTFTDTLFEVAKSCKASIHSMVGDRVSLSWNATHRVLQGEAKAAMFLVKLKAALPDFVVAGAVASGAAEVYSVFSAATKQQALYINSSWLPVLDACFQLATDFQTIVMDGTTAAGAVYDVEAQGVDFIRYRPRVAEAYNSTSAQCRSSRLQNEVHHVDAHPSLFTSKAPIGAYDSLLGTAASHSPVAHLAEGGPAELPTAGGGRQSTPPADPVRCGQFSVASASPRPIVEGVQQLGPRPCTKGDETPLPSWSEEAKEQSAIICKTTLAFEILSLVASREDDEWMYQLQKEQDISHGAEHGGGPFSQRGSTPALLLMLQRRFGEAVDLLEKQVARPQAMMEHHEAQEEGSSISAQGQVPRDENSGPGAVSNNNTTDSASRNTVPTRVSDRLIAFCHESLQINIYGR